jgi:hypothetical protein
LTFLGFDEQGSNIQKKNSDQKPRVSIKKDDTSKSIVKLKEISPVARQTRSNKRKLVLQQEEEVKKILNPVFQNIILWVITWFIQEEWIGNGQINYKR